MSHTSITLLDRLKRQPDDAAWSTLVEIYEPLIRGWLARWRVFGSEADDLVQDVLMVVLRRLGSFERQRTGSFRCWLRSIATNCLRDRWREKHPAAGGSDLWEAVTQLEDPDSGLSREWDREHDRHVTDYLLRQVRPEVTEQTWLAFSGVVLEGQSPQDVAERLGITVNAVFIAKSRVLSRLRQHGQDMLD